VTTLPQLALKLERVAKDLTDAKLLQAVGMEGKRIGTDSIRADTGGDARMSNWRRGRPINLATRFDLVGDSAVEIAPGKRARGPVRVLQDGRRAGVSRKGRPVSASAGKGTWERSTSLMEVELPKVAARHTAQVLRRHF
jgi:hypothetical protein